MVDVRPIKIKERGTTPRKLLKTHNRVGKSAWRDTGRHFHSKMRDRRFTPQHARTANYTPRTRGYQKQKRARKGHNRPLEFSGETRRLVRTTSQTETSKGTKLRYAGARKLNFRHPNSKVRAALEFRRITAGEANQLARVWDQSYDAGINDETERETMTL